MRSHFARLWRETGNPGPPPGLDAAAIRRKVNAALDADIAEGRRHRRQRLRTAAVGVLLAALLAGSALAAARLNFNVLDYFFDGGASPPGAGLVDNTGYSARNDVYAFTVESVAADSSSAVLLVRLEGLTEQTAANLQRDDWMGRWSFHSVNDSGQAADGFRGDYSWHEVMGQRTENSKLLFLHVNFDGAAPEQVELWLDCNEPFSLTLPLNPAQPVAVEVNASGQGLDPAGEVTLRRAELTPLSVGLEVTWIPSTDWEDPLSSYPPRPPVSLRTADGRTVPLTALAQESYRNMDYPAYWDGTSPQDVRMEFYFQTHQDLSQYTALVVWGVEYPIPAQQQQQGPAAQ